MTLDQALAIVEELNHRFVVIPEREEPVQSMIPFVIKSYTSVDYNIYFLDELIWESNCDLRNIVREETYKPFVEEDYEPLDMFLKREATKMLQDILQKLQ
jgi:hypothetical protein